MTLGPKVRAILVGAGIAAGGAIVAYLGSQATQTELGAYGPAVAAIAAVLINALRKALAPAEESGQP